MLFLAISAMMFAGLVFNTSRNIASQRYSASVQDFVTFLRNVYNEVEDAQIANRSAVTTARNSCTLDAAHSAVTLGSGNDLAATGRSDCSVYGKLVTFGENQDTSKAIHVYDVLGNIVDARHPVEASTELNSYGGYFTEDGKTKKGVFMGIFSLDGGTNSAGVFTNYTLASSSYTHTLDWDAWVETTADTNTRFTGALLIVRSPLSGVIHTFYRNYSASAINISQAYSNAASSFGSVSAAYAAFAFNSEGIAAHLSSQISGYTNTSDINFCINSDDRRGQRRRNIRITADASNSSEIILVAADDGSNLCQD